MSLITAMGMTTDRDVHGTRVAKGALGPLAAAINEGPCPAMTMDHDPTLPPLGKVVAARVETRPDDEEVLMQTLDVFERESPVQLPDGSPAIRSEGEPGHRPFLTPEPVEVMTIAYDPVNFQSKGETMAFLRELETDLGAEAFEPEPLFRKAAVPDPVLIITLAKLVVSYFLGKRLIDRVSAKVGDRMADDAAKLYDALRAAMLRFARRAIPKNRPITYLITAPGVPCVELAAVTLSPDLLLSALTEERRGECFQKAEALHAAFGASKVQFLLDEGGTWRFNYMLTSDGAVVGVPESFARQKARKLELQARGPIFLSGAGVARAPDDAP